MTSPATTPLTWNGYVQAVCNMLVVQTATNGGIVSGADPETNIWLPQAVQYAELRIQRDLDLLPARTSRTYTLSSNPFTLSSNDFVTVETILVGSGATAAPLLPVTQEYIQNVYQTATGQPTVFAMQGGDLATGGNTSTLITVGPAPDVPYPVTVTGMVRLPSLYSFASSGTTAGSSTTWISTYLPDLLIQASMVYGSQYQRNFGGTMQANDPGMVGSYESQYQTLLSGAKAENSRARFEASAWSSKSAPINSTPGR